MIGSITAGVYLFDYARHYYLQLNRVRLEPLGLDAFEKQTLPSLWLDPQTIRVVFFGDSRAGEWPSPSIQGYAFANRGLGGQTSAQVAMRYEAHVRPLEPDILVLQVCINDLKTIPLFPAEKDTIISRCKSNIRSILLQAESDGQFVILTTIFPIGEVPFPRTLFWSDEVSLAIDDANRFIRSLQSDQMSVFDSFAILVGTDGRQNQAYSLDELHLNETGYEAINQEFEVVLGQVVSE